MILSNISGRFSDPMSGVVSSSDSDCRLSFNFFAPLDRFQQSRAHGQVARQVSRRLPHLRDFFVQRCLYVLPRHFHALLTRNALHSERTWASVSWRRPALAEECPGTGMPGHSLVGDGQGAPVQDAIKYGVYDCCAKSKSYPQAPERRETI